MIKPELTLQQRRNRVMYRATHRGIRELDVTLGRMILSSHLDMSAHIEAHEEVLELTDPFLEYLLLINPYGEGEDPQHFSLMYQGLSKKAKALITQWQHSMQERVRQTVVR